MAIYLIDYENTKNLLGIHNLSADDCVVIFYSQKANTLTFDIHKEILASPAKIEYKCVDVGGPNALDFQLSTYLGYLIHQNGNEKYNIYIVSKDKGFSYVSSFWKKEKSIDIELVCDLTGKPQSKVVENTVPKIVENTVPKVVENTGTKVVENTVTKVVKNTVPKDDIESVLKQSEAQLNEDEVKEIIVMVNKYKTTQTINGYLNKLFKDSAKAGTVLKVIKPFIKK